MIHLFLDANILLSLYGLAPSEVAELRKLPALIAGGELTLWVTENVRDEFRRNRPKVVADALKALKDSRLRIAYPALSTGSAERHALQTAEREAQRAHSALVDHLEERAHAEQLDADVAIAELLVPATLIASNAFVDAARTRRELRRPPGKNDSLGDAINWEALLASVPNGEDLHFVSTDPDFRSPLDDKRLHEYLSAEWSEKRLGKARLYTDLDQFLSQHFVAVKVPSDVPKVRLINRLRASMTFSETHAIVAELSQYDVFTPEQARLIARHAVRNNQVRWIAADDDVKAFLARIVDSHRASIDAEVLALLERCMADEEPAYSHIQLPDDDNHAA